MHQGRRPSDPRGYLPSRRDIRERLERDGNRQGLQQPVAPARVEHEVTEFVAQLEDEMAVSVPGHIDVDAAVICRLYRIAVIEDDHPWRIVGLVKALD